MRCRNPYLGLTIAELLVASGLLAVVLVTVMTLFAQLLRNTEKNSLLSAGAFFADSVLEQQIAQAEATLAAAPSNATPAFTELSVEGEGFLSTTDNDNGRQTKFLYRVDVEQMTAGVSAEPGQMWFVEVEVRWWSDAEAGPNPVRAGHGNLNFKRGRLAYISRPE